ncbi:hypothetical protein D3C75_583860 [compost metagenome]
MDDVVAVVALQVVVTTYVRDDVVASPPANLVVTVTAFDAVVATIAPDGVVTLARYDDVVSGRITGVTWIGATNHYVVFTGVLQVVRVDTRGARIVANHQRRQRIAVSRVRPVLC